MKTKTDKQQGFTLVEIMIVVAIIGLLAAIAIPNFVRARNTSQTNTCLNNLRQIAAATQQWALENKKQDADIAAWSDIGQYLKNNQYLHCPSGDANGLYSSSAGSGSFVVSEQPFCTYHGTVDAPINHY